jgi:two-component system response regulator NreC
MRNAAPVGVRGRGGGDEVSIRVLIADDHSVVRSGLRALLALDPELAVVGEAANGQETFRLVGELTPDVVMLDIGMPGEDGIQVARRLKASFPQVNVLFLTMHEEPGLLAEALQTGASGYLIKRANEAEILDAVHAVSKGGLYVHPAMTRALVERPPAPVVERPRGGEHLTAREVTVLRLLVRGCTNRQIGEELGLSVRTVESHRATLTAKLGVSSRVELAGYAEEHHLL